ncbi:MAG: T9SS type A sorting domain-containing protein, partial [Flavobacteriaceae bacterium]|nr:T9SS type A sorting domain-containing protein [Flavobacteriaceae bacterium]
QQTSTTSLNGEHSDVPGGIDGTLRVSSRWIYTMRAQSGYANWIYIGNQNGLGVTGLAAGEGFTMKGTGLPGLVGDAHDQLYDFRGRPNDGTITVTVAHSGGTIGEETLTGNPYPSALDMAAFLTDPLNSSIEATAYYWDQNRATNSHYIEAYQGGYGTWIPAGGEQGTYTVPTFIMYDGSGNPLPGGYGTGTLVQRRYAPIGQGFMVRGDASIATGTGTATFTNSMRRHVALGAGNFSEFRNTSGSSLSASSGSVTLPPEPGFDFPTLRFHVEINDLYVRDMVMIFNPEKTKGKDRGWDAKHPSLINTGDAFWKLEEETHPYVIQSRPFDEFDVIPLGLRVRNGVTNFVVKLAESHNFNNDMYLFDLVNNSYQRLDSDNKATVTHNGTAGKVDDRYFIVFRRAIQDDQIPNKIAEMNLDFFQNNRLSQLEVFNPETIDIKSASVYDMSGKLMIHEKNLGMQNTYIFSTANLSSGVYLVKLVTQDDIVVDYKVTVHNKN